MDRQKLPLLQPELLPLWLGMMLTAAVPFLSIWRVGPLSSFFLEAGSLLFALLLVLMSAFSGCLKVKLPAGSGYFAALALFWAAQARLMDLPYTGFSDMAAWAFVVYALLCWACRGWVLRFGQERALAVLAWVLLGTACVQAVIGWMQYTGVAADFAGYLMYRKGIVEGQLGQRNHFGHYLMWGVLAAAWLWAARRLAWTAAAPLVFFLAATMGLTGSRTVFGYVLALLLLLPFLRLLGGAALNRFVCGMGAAALVVLGFQFVLEPMLAVLAGGNITAASERMGGSFGASGRGYEWRKAWQIFQAAPWFGHGWESYSLQGFLTDVYPKGYRPYETGVLFTHSHNSFLNLLAEIGIVGTGLVVGGLLWAVRGCFKRENAVAGVLLLAWMSVSLVHSFFEYPLWYLYFMTVFALFVGLAPTAKGSSSVSGSLKSGWLPSIAGGLAAVLLITAIVRLGFAYQQLRQFSGPTDLGVVKRTENIMGLLTIAKTEPLLRYWAHFQLTAYIEPTQAEFPDWAKEASQSLRQRPFANAYKWALVAERSGDTEAARAWMQNMYRYYPTRYPAYGSAVMLPQYRALHDDYTRACQTYYRNNAQIPDCVPPKQK